QRQRARVDFVLLAIAIARVETMLLVEVVIHARVVLIGVVGRRRREEVVVGVILAPGDVRIGIEFDDRRRDRIPSVRRNDIARNVAARRRRSRAGERGRVVNVLANRGLLGEIAALLDVAARHGGNERLPRAPPRALIAEEEERTVLQYRAADGSAELVL